MQEQSYFQKALADFTQEAASGGAIRHLADMGYTVKQIMERLDFPTPYERVQKAVWERLLCTGVILRKEPGSGGPFSRKGDFSPEDGISGKKAVYVREYDRYGKASFRRVQEEEEEEKLIAWKNDYPEAGADAPARFLALVLEKRRENGESASYMSCDFGLTAYRNPEIFQEQLGALQERQREYLLGLPWERRRVYHKLDSRMTEILGRLLEAGAYEGECLFTETKDRLYSKSQITS